MSTSITSMTAAAGDGVPQPKFMSSFRRFGRHDSFQPIKSSTSSIGSKSFGNITVDCQLLFDESQWGTLKGLPGGIMYLNLHFGAPQGSRLREATIAITLDEQDARLLRYTENPPTRTRHHSGVDVGFTDWYGPQALSGERKSASVTSTTTAVPNVSVLGYGAGGVGYERATRSTKESRWAFSGQLGRGKRTSTYTTLSWHLRENELSEQSLHNPKIHTAFAFEHSGQPFLMKLDISGRLHNWQGNVQSKLKFGVDGAREGKVVTLVDFEDYHRFSRGLDGIARGLPRAMEMANLQAVPVEVPESITGTSFQEVRASSSAHPSPQFLLQLLPGGGSHLPEDEPSPTAADYRRLLSSREQAPSTFLRKRTLPNGDIATVSRSSTVPRTKAKERKSTSSAPLDSSVGGNFTMLQMLWWGFMQLFATITTRLDSASSVPKNTADARVEE